MAQDVMMPDGTLVSMPEKVSPEQAAALSSLLQKSKPPSALEDVGQRAVPRAIIRGLFALPDMGTAMVKGLGSLKPTYDIPQVPGGELAAEDTAPAQAVRDYMSRVKPPSESLIEATGIKPPATGPGRYTEEAGAGAIGALSFPGSIVPKVISGAAGGAGGELGANLLEDKPWARVASAIAGSTAAYPAFQAAKLGASLLGGPSTQTARIVSDAAKGTTPAEFDAMKAGQDAGRAAGVETTPVQNLARPSPLHALQEKVTTQSPELMQMLAGQNAQAQSAGRRFLGDIAPPAEPSAVATRAQGAAEGAIKKAQEFATAATAPDFQIEILKAPAPYVRAAAADMVARTNESPAAREFLRREVFGKISPSAGGFSIPEIKNTLNEAKQSLRDLGTPGIASSGVDNHAAGLIRDSLKDLETLVSAASANRPQGIALMREIYERIVDPMKASLTGKIAGVEGVVEGGVPPTTRILGELNAPTVRAESIHKLASDMTRAGDAQAFPSLVRATWEQNLEKAFGGIEGSAANAPARFAAALRGTAEQTAKRENFRAAMAEVARANGLSGRAIDETVIGAEKLMSVMEAAGRAKGGMTGALPSAGGVVENVVLRGGAGAASGAQLRVFGPISDMMNRKAYKEIAGLLASRDGVEQLRELAKFDLRKYRMSAVSGAAAGVGSQVQER